MSAIYLTSQLLIAFFPSMPVLGLRAEHVKTCALVATLLVALGGNLRSWWSADLVQLPEKDFLEAGPGTVRMEAHRNCTLRSVPPGLLPRGTAIGWLLAGWSGDARGVSADLVFVSSSPSPSPGRPGRHQLGDLDSQSQLEAPGSGQV
jgi:hypothetical protein